MIFKRTKNLTSARRLVEWAGSYQDETVKHKGADLSMLGLKLGREYFTLRPPGHLSVHGYPVKEVGIIQLEKQCPHNAAVVDWLQQHCKEQKKKMRKVLGIRAVASMTPDTCQELIEAKVDVDRVLEAGIVRTFQSIQEAFYPGDELGFIMGIHHDRMTGELYGRADKPNLHAHLFVLPQTRKGLRLSMSDNSFPRGDGQAVDMLSEFRSAFIMGMDIAIGDIKYEQFVAKEDPLVAAKVQEASARVIKEWLEREDLKPEDARQWAVEQFKHYLSQSPEQLRRRLVVWEQEATNLLKRPLVKRKHEAQENIKAVFDSLRKPFLNRGAVLDEVIEKMRKKKRVQVNFANVSGLHCWLEPGTEPTEERNSLTEDIREAVRKLQLREASGRINIVGECAIAELQLGMTMQPHKMPNWFQILSEAVTFGSLSGIGPDKGQDKGPDKERPEPGQTHSM